MMPIQMKKSAQRRRKHCMLAVVRRSQTFLPRCRSPFSGALDGQNLISWRSFPYKASLVRINAYSFELSW